MLMHQEMMKHQNIGRPSEYPITKSLTYLQIIIDGAQVLSDLADLIPKYFTE